MSYRVTLLPGDGIGPEIVAEGRKVLTTVGAVFAETFDFETELIGGHAIDERGVPLPEVTLETCRAADAVLLGAVGGPKWDDPRAKVRPEQGLLELRKRLDLFANLRPITVHPKLASASPLKDDRLAGVDILVVRELTGGIYFGEPRERNQVERLGMKVDRAIDTMDYSVPEVERVVRLACTLAAKRKKRVTSIDKANVLESSRLWREVASRVVADEFPAIELEHQLVDSAAMRLITHASSFDVMVTGNMFGDILTDEASVLSGSLGLLASASVSEGSLGVYEPIHGSAPDIAGQGIANPMATILSVAMLLRYSLGLEDAAAAVEKAVYQCIDDGIRTQDLGGGERAYGTEAVGDAICERLKKHG